MFNDVSNSLVHFPPFFSLFHYTPHNPLQVLVRQAVVHREADDLVGDARGLRKVGRIGGFQILIGVKCADERVEIPPA